MTLTEATQEIERMAGIHGGKLKAKTNFQFSWVQRRYQQ